MTLNLKNKLLKRKKKGNLRALCITKSLIDFASNDYLGLARSPDFGTMVREEWSRNSSFFNGLGSTGSRLLTGNSSYAEHLEHAIATFHGYEAALLFNCGYMANIGLISAIVGEKDVLFFDEKVHASTREGIRLSRGKAFPFKHQDLSFLENRLKNCSIEGNRWICIESIYSTDGSQAPLLEFSLLAKKYDALLIVDEAHAIGVCGPNGRGRIAEHHLMNDVFAQIHTFGKALGCYGAVVLGSNLLKEALINFATSYVYTTALPLQVLAAIKCSYDLFPKLEKERRKLQECIQLFRHLFPTSSETHIQPVMIEGNEQVKALSQSLMQKGFDIRPLMSPTVRQKQEMLRISLHAFNREREIKMLLEYLKFYAGEK